LLLPRPKLTATGKLPPQGKQVQRRRPTSFLPPVEVNVKVNSFFSFSLFFLPFCLENPLYQQMTDSYPSSRNGNLSASPNGAANGSSPSPANNAAINPITRKKLMGYVGFANLPNQVHRKSVRKGFQFTAMVVGMC